MATAILIETARNLGGNAADGYWDEFNEVPTRENCGDWDEAAWSVARKELTDTGMTDADYDACLAAWRAGFFGSALLRA